MASSSPTPGVQDRLDGVLLGTAVDALGSPPVSGPRANLPNGYLLSKIGGSGPGKPAGISATIERWIIELIVSCFDLGRCLRFNCWQFDYMEYLWKSPSTFSTRCRITLS